MLKHAVVIGWAILAVVASASAALEFTPAPGYSATPVWSGSGGAHLAMDGSDFFIYGAEATGTGANVNAVRWFDGATTVEIARSPEYAGANYAPDAITAVGGAVYWVHAESFASGAKATLYKTRFDGGAWTTSTVFDASAGVNVFSLSTDGQNVFGVGLDSAGQNVAFYLDDTDAYRVFAQLPADASGGSGFDPAGDFFAGAWSVNGDWVSHMYSYSAGQVADRLSGAAAAPYDAGDAVADLVLSSNASAVMEGDGGSLFGTDYNATFMGTNPVAYDVASGAPTPLGTLGGAANAVAVDTYYRDGAVYFMAKDDWNTGAETRIYRVVPEPGALCLMLLGASWASRRRTPPARLRPQGAGRTR